MILPLRVFGNESVKRIADAPSSQGLRALRYVPDLEYLQHVADEQFVCAED